MVTASGRRTDPGREGGTSSREMEGEDGCRDRQVCRLSGAGKEQVQQTRLRERAARTGSLQDTSRTGVMARRQERGSVETKSKAPEAKGWGRLSNG